MLIIMLQEKNKELLKAEFKKIIWPDRKTVFKQALVVTAISVVIGVIIAVLDMVLQYGISFLTM